MQELTKIEQNRLSFLETVITQGEQTFVRVGQALMEIRDKRLYRKDYKSFDDYVQSKWFKGKRWATRMIAAALVVEEVTKDASSIGGPMVPKLGDIIPNERTARELAKVPTEKRAKVVEAAAKTGAVNVKTIAEAAKVVSKATTAVFYDDIGTPIPEQVLHIWDRREEIETLLRELAKVKHQIVNRHHENDPLFRGINQNCLDKLTLVLTEINSAYPEVVCGSCEGRVPKTGCGTCRSTGFQSKRDYERLTPEEDKKIRKAAIESRRNAAPRLPTAVSRLNP